MRRATTAIALVGLVAGPAACASTPRQPHRAKPSPTQARTRPAPKPPTANRDRGTLWTSPLAGDVTLDPRSSQLVSALAGTVAAGDAAHRATWIDTKNCAPRVYTAPADQPKVRVALLNGDRPARRSLQAALDAVPLPAGAVGSACHDQSLVVEQPSTNRMWELWHARKTADGWQADWGGATRHLYDDDGVFGPDDWPGAMSYWGASASSLRLVGGLLTSQELQSGNIEHALALSVPQAAAGVWSSPAQRTDGVSRDPNALMYGARLRLDPAVDVDKLRVPAVTKALARAAQRYGLVVREQTHYNVQFSAEAPPADDPGVYRRIFSGPAPLNGSAGPVMRGFPWSALQVVKLHLRRR